MADPDGEAETTPGKLRQGQGLLGEGHGVPWVDGDDAVPQPDGPRGLCVGGEDQERIASPAVGHPEALVPPGLGLSGQLHREPEVRPRHQICAGSFHE